MEIFNIGLNIDSTFLFVVQNVCQNDLHGLKIKIGDP